MTNQPPATGGQSDEQWRSRLSPERFHVLREGGTERPFSGALLTNKQPGKYVCGGCGAQLFDSDRKYDSGSGWPSFTAPVSNEAVSELGDESLGMRRTEVRCAKCGGHLGHVFPDGPGPGGLRYCINSLSLDFAADDHPEKAPGDRG